MKKLKRTTIKIRQRELVIVKGGATADEQTEAESVQICPVCRFPFAAQKTLEDKAVKQLHAANNAELKKINNK